MDEAAREQLAQRLSEMSLKAARKEIVALDPGADMKYFRNAIQNESHTLYLLPRAGLSIALVERDQTRDSDRKIGGGPRGWTAKKVAYEYVGARVNLLQRPAYPRTIGDLPPELEGTEEHPQPYNPGLPG
jgi:hypothetical protein